MSESTFEYLPIVPRGQDAHLNDPGKLRHELPG